MVDFLARVGVLMVAIPVTAYVTVKLCRYAWLRGGEIFRQERTNDER